MKAVINEKSYAPVGKFTPHSQITLTVHAILDLVPGAFFDPEDLMKWICENPYVRLVTLDSVEKSGAQDHVIDYILENQKKANNNPEGADDV